MEFVGICLITRNVNALASFYSKVLGVGAEGSGDHMELKIQGMDIAIYSEEGMESMAPGSMQSTL